MTYVYIYIDSSEQVLDLVPNQRLLVQQPQACGIVNMPLQRHVGDPRPRVVVQQGACVSRGVQKTPLLFNFFLCLSRACLGKYSVFSTQWRERDVSAPLCIMLIIMYA